MMEWRITVYAFSSDNAFHHLTKTNIRLPHGFRFLVNRQAGPPLTVLWRNYRSFRAHSVRCEQHKRQRLPLVLQTMAELHGTQHNAYMQEPYAQSAPPSLHTHTTHAGGSPSHITAIQCISENVVHINIMSSFILRLNKLLFDPRGHDEYDGLNET